VNSALPAAAPDGLTRLDYLHGAWTGHGEFRDDQANLHYFAQTETVTPRLRGELLSIEGIGHDRDDVTRATHLAFAIVSYDIGRRNYPWPTAAATGSIPNCC